MKKFLFFSLKVAYFCICTNISRVVAGPVLPFTGCEDATWRPFKDEKCLKFVDQFLSHEDATQACLTLTDHLGQLTQIKSLEEQDFVTNLIFGEYQVVDNVWLGATRGGVTETDFEWPGGHPLQFTHWAEGHPTNDAEKNCTQLTSHLSTKGGGGAVVDNLTLTEMSPDGEWMDVSCLKRNLVVCEKAQDWSMGDVRQILLQVRSDLEALHLAEVYDPTTIKNCMDVQQPQFFPAALSRRFILRNGKYDIYPVGLEAEDGKKQKISVQCDFETDGGGWTVIQRRNSGPLDQFFLNWTDYEQGFGSVDGNYWLGLKAIHALTSNGVAQELRIELGDWDATHGWAKYKSFRVANATHLYRLSVAGYEGNVGDAMDYHNGLPFSTRDRDNDNWSQNCAEAEHGAWWYGSCAYSCLNGYYYSNSTAEDWHGVSWERWKGDGHSYKNVEMKIRDVTV